MIPYGRQDIDESDIEAVVRVLRSDWLTQGPEIELFEKSVTQYCGAKYAVAVSSATAGLHLAYIAHGLKSGDRLWTSPNTFAATANAALYCGAIVEFVDIDPQTYNLSVASLQEKLEAAEKQGTLPKIVVPVHFTGQPCEMRPIAELSRRYGFKVIEDGAHAIGSEYLKSKIGSCAFSDGAVFSFHPVKVITSGEGGVVTTNDAKIFEKLKLLRSHGITREENLMHSPSQGPWYYEQIELGFHYRLTDIQAVLGTSQMKRIDTFVARRQVLVNRYNDSFEKLDLPLIRPMQTASGHSASHLYVVQIDLKKTKHTHRQIFESLRRANIGVNLHYIPVYFHPYYQNLGFQKGLCPVAENYYQRAMSLPLYYGLTEEKQDYVINKLRELLT